MLRTSLRPAFAAAALTAMLLTGTAAFAATENFTADLKGSTEVPPNDFQRHRQRSPRAMTRPPRSSPTP